MKKITFLFSLLLTVSMYAQQNITFRVDMAGQTFTNVYVSGSFNGWSGTSNQLMQVGASTVYAATIPLADGEYEYKFTFDDWTGQDSFTQGDVCTITNYGNTNRRLVISGSDQTLDVAPFNGCAETAVNPGPHSITLNVDMSGYGGDLSAGVTVNGEFNGWCGACNPLVDQGGGIWSITFPLNEQAYQFKFTVGNWAAQELFSPGDPETATDGTFTNRYLKVDEAKTIDYTWDTPMGNVLSARTFELSEVKLYPNPTENQWQVTSKDDIEKVEVYNLLGKRVLSLTPRTRVATIVADKLNSGIYLAKIETASGTGAMKLIKK